MIIQDICLSDIPADKRRKSEKNGKVYCSIVVDERKQPDQYGNTHTVYMNQTKDERTAKAEKVYVGNGKELVFTGQKTEATTPAEKSSDGLPF